MKTVLVMGDDPANMQVFTALLWSSGYHVLEATTGTEAIELAKQDERKVDLLLTDIALPDRRGTDVALELLAVNSEMSVLFISGNPFFAWERQDQNNFKMLPSDRIDMLEKAIPAPRRCSIKSANCWESYLSLYEF